MRIFQESGKKKAKVHPGKPFTTFTNGERKFLCGDFFKLVPGGLRHVRLVYDRAALIALPPEMRRGYVEHLTAVIPRDTDTRVLPITLNYDSA